MSGTEDFMPWVISDDAASQMVLLLSNPALRLDFLTLDPGS